MPPLLAASVHVALPEHLIGTLGNGARLAATRVGGFAVAGAAHTSDPASTRHQAPTGSTFSREAAVRKRILGRGLLAGLLLFAMAGTAAAGALTTLYRFKGGDDGDLPIGPLVADRQGNLYGTT